MPATVRCPHCGRKQPRPDTQGTVLCDGCEEAFDANFVPTIPSPIRNRVAGSFLMLLGLPQMLFALLLIFVAVTRGPGPVEPVSLIGLLVSPMIMVFCSSALLQERIVHSKQTSPGPPAVGGWIVLVIGLLQLAYMLSHINQIQVAMQVPIDRASRLWPIFALLNPPAILFCAWVLLRKPPVPEVPAKPDTAED